MICSKCGYKKELVVETSILDGSRKIMYMERCRCGGKIVDFVFVRKSNGKVEVIRPKSLKAEKAF